MPYHSSPSFNTKDARLRVLSTGADACTEHEIGIKPLLEKLSGRGGLMSRCDYGLAKKTGVITDYPDILSFRKVTNGEAIKAAQKAFHGSTFFVVGTHTDFRDMSRGQTGLYAEWDESTFLFAAPIGSKEARLLEQFFSLAQNGHLIIGSDPASDITGDDVFSGITFSDIRQVSEKTLKKIQEDFVNKCRIWEESEILDVRARYKTISGNDHSYIWPVRDRSGQICYVINPSYSLSAVLGSRRRAPSGRASEFLQKAADLWSVASPK